MGIVILKAQTVKLTSGRSRRPTGEQKNPVTLIRGAPFALTGGPKILGLKTKEK